MKTIMWVLTAMNLWTLVLFKIHDHEINAIKSRCDAEIAEAVQSTSDDTLAACEAKIDEILGQF